MIMIAIIIIAIWVLSNIIKMIRKKNTEGETF